MKVERILNICQCHSFEFYFFIINIGIDKRILSIHNVCLGIAWLHGLEVGLRLVCFWSCISVIVDCVGD
jgi:hypothetical protein